MKELLVVIDYQNDFVNGALGFEGADFLAVLGWKGESEQQYGEGEQEVSGCHCAEWLEGVILSWS